MKKIENIVIKGGVTPTSMNTGANRQLEALRRNNPEYDDFLKDTAELLKDCESPDAKRIYKTLVYKGKALDIIRDVLPHVNDMYNDGFTPKGVLNAVMDGTWMNLDYAIVYENIEFESPRFYEKFLTDYLKLVNSEEESLIIKRVFLSVNLDGKECREITPDMLKDTKQIIVKTAVRVPFARNILGPSYWESLHLNTKDFHYRSLVEHRGSLKAYAYDGKVRECVGNGTLSSDEWEAEEFVLTFRGEITDDMAEKFDGFAEKYGLEFPYTFSENYNIGGKLKLDLENLLHFRDDLESLRCLLPEDCMTMEGILTSVHAYLKENLEFLTGKDGTSIRVVSF